MIDRAVDGLRADPVYVDGGAEVQLTAQELSDLRDAVSRAGAPFYIAFLPAAAAAEVDGTPEGVLRRLVRRLPGEETVAVLVGKKFRGGSTELPRGQGGKLATEAFQEHRGEGIAPTLLAYLDLVQSDGDESGVASEIPPEDEVIDPAPGFGFEDPSSGIGGFLPVLVPLVSSAASCSSCSVCSVPGSAAGGRVGARGLRRSMSRRSRRRRRTT
jgi:hypothetical protein